MYYKFHFSEPSAFECTRRRGLCTAETDAFPCGSLEDSNSLGDGRRGSIGRGCLLDFRHQRRTNHRRIGDAAKNRDVRRLRNPETDSQG